MQVLKILTIVALIASATDAFGAKRNSKSAFKSTRIVHKAKTSKFKYDEKAALSLPFSYQDMGMSDAEFFISNKEDHIIKDEIDRIQGSLSELDYTTQVSYEPKYLNQRPSSAKQKRAYMKGYLRILEEATL